MLHLVGILFPHIYKHLFLLLRYTMQVTVVALNLVTESHFYCSYCLFDDAACSSCYIRRMLGLLANNELERIWKEAILV